MTELSMDQTASLLLDVYDIPSLVEYLDKVIRNSGRVTVVVGETIRTGNWEVRLPETLSVRNPSYMLYYHRGEGKVELVGVVDTIKVVLAVLHSTITFT